MTTVVGFQGDGFAILGADSQITDGDRKILSISTPKIVKVGKYLLAVRGDCRPGDILIYNWKPPSYISGDPVEFMGKKVIPSIIQAFKENGYDHEKEGASFAYLLAFNGNIFEIGEDLSISQTHNGIYSVGSGGSYALGYLTGIGNTLDKRERAKKELIKALEISAGLDINTSGPFQIELQLKR